tara:strand:- start:867 stop:2051 length:1185 start_codon:yes stop_codon:yes gene_type:complete
MSVKKNISFVRYCNFFYILTGPPHNLKGKALKSAIAGELYIGVSTLYPKISIWASEGLCDRDGMPLSYTGTVSGSECDKEKPDTDNGLNSALASLANELQKSAVNVDKVKEIVQGEIRKADVITTVHVIKKINGEIKKFDDPLPECFDRLLALASMRKHTLLVGPSGCGKSHVTRLVAEALELPFYSISITAGMSEAQLAGWMIPGDNGQFEYRRSPFVKAYEDGGIFCLDEIDSADPNTLTFLNSALSNGEFSIPNRPEKPALRHKDNIVFATANTFMNGADRVYAGRNQQDGASKDRFAFGKVFMDYDQTVEKKLIRRDVLDWGMSMRNQISQNGLKHIVSTRFLMDLTSGADNYPDFWGTQKHWFEQLTMDWKDDEKKKVRYDGNKIINGN